ncbi:uncharacterized protein [Rutidosis leptorrhynchoides]|uniref:uncharacterized protein n=1 Tax=Rutidosis leptorrhynchoides TaxID=125765 RepID=UPI003A98D39C
MVESGSRHSASTGTWQRIIEIGSLIDAAQVQFKNSFIKSVGDGNSTSFWCDRWLGNEKLCNLFPRLFNLERVKDVSIKDRVVVSDSIASAVWCWRREPSGRASRELDSLTNLLVTFSFNCRIPDSWHWSMASDGVFRVKILASEIDGKMLTSCGSNQSTLRNNLAPKKIEIFVWRALRKRLPVLMELDKRGIDLHSVRCPLCDNDVESVDNTLIFCKSSLDVWDRISHWWNMGNFSNFSIKEICSIPESNSMSPLEGNYGNRLIGFTCILFGRTGTTRFFKVNRGIHR